MSIADRELTAAAAQVNRVRRLYEALSEHELEAQWRIESSTLRFEPAPRAWTWLWKGHVLENLAWRAGMLVDVERSGNHRALACVNPGLRRAYGAEVYGATQTLWAAMEYLGPGEQSPAHRHSMAAVRLVVSGSSVWTTVNGDRCLMAPGDLVVTPAWAWHDHANDSVEPAVWFNGLDFPLTAYMDAQFLELHPLRGPQPVADTHAGQRAWSVPGLAPQALPAAVEASFLPTADGVVPARRTAALRYPWPRTRAALEALRHDPGDPFDGVLLHYVDPLDGGPISPTMGAAIQLLVAGASTRPHRHVHSAVYVVLDGAGFSVVDGVRFDWTQGDVLALPPWAIHEHHAPHGDAILFSISDQPALAALGLDRVAELEQRQAIHASFSGCSDAAR